MACIEKEHLGKQVEVITAVGKKKRFWVKEASEGGYLEVRRHDGRRGFYCSEYQSIKVVKEKPDNVYDPENIKARINYAVQCIIRGIHSRKADTCFEMGDGSEVLHAVLLRSKKNQRLLDALKKDGNGNWFNSLIEMDRRDYPDCPVY